MRRLTTVAALVLALAVPAAAAVAGTTAFPPVAGNPADRLAGLPIDPYAYDGSTRCLRRPARGTLALQGWLGANAGGTSWGIMRCSKLGKDRYSLHAEGRALDWHLNARSARDRREAMRLIGLLLAPDRLGTPHALARRMGIQEIIWDCRSWWSGSAALGRYSPCFKPDGTRKRIDVTTAHRDHIHFGLSKAGARMRTTFWAPPAL